MVSTSDEVRPPRWRFQIATRVTIQPPGGTPETVDGEIEDASTKGVCVRLPCEVPVGSHLNLTMQEGMARGGVVRWTVLHEISGYLHGLEMDRPLERHAKASRPLARLRCRLFFRRLLLLSIALGLMTLAVAGLVWLMEAMHAYNPKYYEPKDIERERYEIQRPSGDNKQPPPRP